MEPVNSNAVVHFELNINASVNQRNSQEPATNLVEGENIEKNFLTIMKTGRSNFAYNVTLNVKTSPTSGIYMQHCFIMGSGI